MSQPPMPDHIAEFNALIESGMEAARANTIRWNSTHCPICRGPLDLEAAGWPKEALAQPWTVFVRMSYLEGDCPNCGLSPRDVSEDEVSQWVWVRIPGHMDVSGSIGNHITRAQGANWGEVLQSLETRYPDFKLSPYLDNPKITSKISIVINNDSTYGVQELDTPLRGGDYLYFLIRGM